MAGTSSRRDRQGHSPDGEAPARRRVRAASRPQGSLAKGIRTITTYMWNRKLTLIYLVLMVLLAFAVRTVWYYDAAYTGGPTPLLSGNDPDYHKRTVDYFVNNHHFLMRDPLIDYPQGGPNPNPPAYSTSIALVGYLLTPFFGFDTGDAVWFSMEIAAALWAALTVIPVYLFTKEMFGRKSGYAAAFILAMMAGNIERTPLGFSDHDAFFMFFTVTGFFFLLKALRHVRTRNYVESWRSPNDITVGIQQFMRTNSVSILYAAMAGVSLATVALTWKGYPYVMAIIFVYLLFHMMLNKFRRIDNTAVGMVILTAVSITMLIPLPYYMSMHFMHWYEAPAIIYAAIVAVIAVFVFSRDLPWLLIIPVLLGLLAAVLTLVYFLLPNVWVNVFSGAGYFIRTKLYGTIAEAQPPDVNRLVFSYGMTTFFLALAGVFIMLKDMPKGWKNDHIFTTIWALTSIYMAVAAIRFMYNATPVFAILSGWILYDILHRLDYRRMIRVFRSMRGDMMKAFKYAVKLRHVAGVLFLVFLIVMPNSWHGVDAGIPYETKKDADKAVYDSLPSWMRPSSTLYDPDSNSLWYFGSFGTSFMNDYWAQGMWWLRQQDDWQEEQDRPAFISWWDYGHWCVQVGQHPTAADNFQNGVEFAGNFIAAQSQKQGEALMLLRLMQVENNRPEVKQFMYETFGEVNASALLDLFIDPAKYTPEIAKYPERYGLKDPEVSTVNTVYIVGTYIVEKALTEDQIVDGLLWFRNKLGLEFRYFAVDSRLMPISERNTGIFYAPITLSDNRVDEYIEIVAVYNGNQITFEQAAGLPASEQQNLEYKLVWKRPFYESMFYRAFMGYSGYDQGPAFSDAGIPLLSGDLQNSIPLPGWNMTHWRVVHRTVHWNPYNETVVSDHSLDWKSISEEDAQRYYDEKKGTVDEVIRTIGDGVIYLKYYAGAWINGTVMTEAGEPVSGATITVYDDFRFFHDYYAGGNFVGIPHGTTQTDDQGRFSIIAPFGNVTVVASNGGNMEYTNLRESNLLNMTNVLISDDQAMRVGEYNFTVELLVPPANLDGTLFADQNSDSTFTEKDDLALANSTLKLVGKSGLNRTYELHTRIDGYFGLADVLPGSYDVSATYQGHTVVNFTTVTVGPNETRTQDLAVPLQKISGKLTRKDGKAVLDTELIARDLQNNKTLTAKAVSNGDYKFERLLPGNYSVELYVPGTRPINETVVLNMGSNQVLNLTLLPTAFVEGTVFNDEDGSGDIDAGEGVTNATISFTRLWGGDFRWTTTTNATGHYNTSLPSGIYSVYIHETEDDVHTAALATLEVDADEWSYALDLEMQRAYRLNGTLKSVDETNASKTKEVSRAPIDIWTDDGARIRLTSNRTGVFSLWLPPDSYSFFATSQTTVAPTRPLIDLRRVNVTNAAIDLGTFNLTNGTSVQGNVYFDRNNNDGVDSGEGRGGIELILEAGGFTFNVTTLANGSYKMRAAPFNYSVRFDAEGFEPYNDHINATLNLATSGKNIELKGLNLTYTGIIGYDVNDDNNLTGEGMPGILVEYTVDTYPGSSGKATKVTTDATGSYTISLYPGSYRVKITYNVEEAIGPVQYSYNAILEVLPGTDNRTYNIWLNKLVKVNGTLEIEDGVLDRSEFIRADEGATTKYITVTDGNFSDYLSLGKHTLVVEIYKYNGTASTITHSVVQSVDLRNATELHLVARRVVWFNGTVFYDKNQNGTFDAGEGLQIFSFALNGDREELVSVESNGNFTGRYYPNANYTILVQRTIADPYAAGEAEFYYNATIDLTTSKRVDISVERRLPIDGHAWWDKNRDDKAQSTEYLASANVTFTNATNGRTYNVTTGLTGSFRIFLPVSNETTASYTVNASLAGYSPKVPDKIFNISEGIKAFDPELVAENVTLQGLTFRDLNGDGELDRYERGVSVHNITFWETTNVSNRFTASTDINGSFGFVIPPGTYDVHAWTPSGTTNIVFLGTVEVQPTGGDFKLELPMAVGRMASGTMFYHNHTGANETAPDANITFRQVDGDGILPVMLATGGSFQAVLPEGRYFVNGTFNTTQFGVTMRYTAQEQFRVVLADRDDWDINFTKIAERKLTLSWSDIPSLIDQNASVNYTIYAQNTGSENATFDLSMDLPQGWTYQLERNNITLNLSQRGGVWVVINSSVQAQADMNNCTLLAMPRNATDEPSKLTVAVKVRQVFGFEIKETLDKRSFYTREPDGRRHMTYSFSLESSGNGRDRFNITLGTILNWTIEYKGINPINLGPYGVEPHVPFEVFIPPQGTLTKQTIRITVTSLTDPNSKPKVLEMVITFPDLTAKSGDVKLSEAGKTVKQPHEAPGLGALAVVVAIGVAGTVARRRRAGRWT